MNMSTKIDGVCLPVAGTLHEIDSREAFVSNACRVESVLRVKTIHDSELHDSDEKQNKRVGWDGSERNKNETYNGYQLAEKTQLVER